MPITSDVRRRSAASSSTWAALKHCFSMVIALVALVVIGPKDLPRVMRSLGKWVGQARGMAKHFRGGLDTMMREAELEEMEKKWRADNERIMP